MRLSALLYGGLLVLQMLTMNMLFSDYANDYNNRFEERRLQIAVNYAVDAATKEMKEDSANLGQDYEAIGKLNVDPMVAMDTFATVLCKNYNVPVNSINLQSIMMDYCPVFLVATYDGYYIANKVKINDAGVENMMFSPKFPYSSLHTELDGSTSFLSFNMSLSSVLKVDKNGSVYKIDNPPGMTKEDQSAIINNTISDVLNDALIKYGSTDTRGEIFIPAQATTIKATNAIKNTTVFAYIDNFDLSGYGMNLQSFGIGGAEIKQKKVVVGFEINVGGKMEKYYAYSDETPAGVTPVTTFESQKEAAENGYYYYTN